MRKIAAAIFLIVGLLIPSSPPVNAQGEVVLSEPPSFLFALSASSVSIEGKSLALTGVDSILYFSDRPNRIAGHMSTENFVGLWQAKAEGHTFCKDPPNAVLALVDSDGAKDVVIVLNSAALDGDALSFKFTVIEGEMPSGDFGIASLFVDPQAQCCALNTCNIGC